jgi:AmmeMemoRadiSam system protein A
MSFTPDEQTTLLEVARSAIAAGLESGGSDPVSAEGHPESLQAVRSTFVTLRMQGRLRGCVGGLEAKYPLVVDVHRHAYAAAFSDPRFTPLTAAEYPRLDIHISVLSPHSPLPFEDEAELIAQLRPEIDGLIIALGDRRATFLPAVWESLSDPETFVAQLKQKARIPAEVRWYQAWRYTTEAIPAS